MSPDNGSSPLAGGQKRLQLRTTGHLEGSLFQNEGDGLLLLLPLLVSVVMRARVHFNNSGDFSEHLETKCILLSLPHHGPWGSG